MRELIVCLVAAFCTYVAPVPVSAHPPTAGNHLPCHWTDHDANGVFSGDWYITVQMDHYEAAWSEANRNLWNNRHISEGDWNDGWGWGDDDTGGYIGSALVRQYNALSVLRFSSTDYIWNLNTSYYKVDILVWGANYVHNYSKRFKPECPGASSTTGAFNPSQLNKTVIFYPKYFWGDFGNAGFPPNLKPPHYRAATLVHETRHQSKAHTKQDDSDCGRLNSCDPDFFYNGANTWEITWLFNYSRKAVLEGDANPNHALTTTPYIRNLTFDRAAQLLDHSFHQAPDFHLQDVVDIHIVGAVNL